MKRLKAALLVLVGFALLTASKCIGETPIELCYQHPIYGAVCVKINGKNYDIDRSDLTPEQRKEVKDWVAEQTK